MVQALMFWAQSITSHLERGFRVFPISRALFWVSIKRSGLGSSCGNEGGTQLLKWVKFQNEAIGANLEVIGLGV